MLRYLCLVALVASGCGRAASEDPPVQPVVVVPIGAPVADGGVAVAPAAPLAIEVKLLEPGAEPRRPLRLTLGLGARSLEIETKVGQTAAKAKKRLPRPRMAANSSGCTVALLATQIELVCGADKVTAPLSPRGVAAVVVGEEGSADEPARQARAQLVAGLAPPLPAEAVGAGARWEVVHSESRYGIPRRRVVRYQLEALDGETARIRWSEGGTASPHRLRPPSPHARGDLAAFELVGDGEATLALADPAASTARGTTSEWAKVRSFSGSRAVFLDVVTVTSFEVRGAK